MGKGYRDKSNKNTTNFIMRMQQDIAPVAKHTLQTASAGYTHGKDFTNCREVFLFFNQKGGVCYEVEVFCTPYRGDRILRLDDAPLSWPAYANQRYRFWYGI